MLVPIHYFESGIEIDLIRVKRDLWRLRSIGSAIIYSSTCTKVRSQSPAIALLVYSS